MNDLRRILLWISVMGVLAIGVWGLQWDERSGARPFAPEYREFRENHRLEAAGYVFYVPLGRMLAGWGAILCAAVALWPLATAERSSRWLGRFGRPGPAAGERMRGTRALLGVLLGAWLLGAREVPAVQDPVAPAEESGTSSLSAKEAERLFLGFINDRENLIRSCHFLGGVRIEEILPAERMATVRIRYRIECLQEEITLPPLTRTLRENFVYRDLGENWEMVGRASELSPGSLEARSAPLAQVSETPDPRALDRRDVVEKILSWAVSGRMPDGVKQPFPGADLIPGKLPVLVSSEGLEGVTDLTVAGRKVILLSPEALLERTALESGGVWFRFEVLELSGDSARARVGLVTRLLPAPRAGTSPTRVLSRVEADFLREGPSWVLTRYRPLN